MMNIIIFNSSMNLINSNCTWAAMYISDLKLPLSLINFGDFNNSAADQADTYFEKIFASNN